MVAASNRSMEKSDDCRPESAEVPSHATQELDLFFDCLVQVIGDAGDESVEVSASWIANNSLGEQTGEEGDASEIAQKETVSSLSVVQTELLELLEPDRTDVETTQAMEELLEVLAIESRSRSSASSANEAELAHLRQLNIQMSDRLLQLEEQLDASHFRQLNAQLSDKVNHLEEQLRASHQQLDRLLPQVSELLALQTTETRAKEQYKKRFFTLGLVVCTMLGGLGIWAISREPSPSNRQVVSEVERSIVALNQIDGMMLSAKFDRGNVTLAGTAHQSADLEKIAQTVGQIPGVKTVTNTVKIEPISIATRLYFQTNSATVVSLDLEGKLRQIKQVMQQYPQLQLKIIGHAHPGEPSNGTRNLALERSQAVQTILEDIGIDRRRTIALSRPGSPPDIAPNQPSWLSQCVLFETTMGEK
ncbi:MAG: BON domain-containing protein [Geitlerinemataceae cyanobacterium]